MLQIEVLNVLVGGTCDNILGKFQATLLICCLRLLCSLVNRFFFFHTLTWLEMTVGKLCTPF